MCLDTAFLSNWLAPLERLIQNKKNIEISFQNCNQSSLRMYFSIHLVDLILQHEQQQHLIHSLLYSTDSNAIRFEATTINTIQTELTLVASQLLNENTYNSCQYNIARSKWFVHINFIFSFSSHVLFSQQSAINTLQNDIADTNDGTFGKTLIHHCDTCRYNITSHWNYRLIAERFDFNDFWLKIQWIQLDVRGLYELYG